MAWLLACMIRHATVKRPPTLVSAIEHPSPAFRHRSTSRIRVKHMAFLLLTTVAAQHFFFHLTAIAPRRYTHLASTAKAFVTHIIMPMLAARHDLTADLATAPAADIVRLGAALCNLVFAAKAYLYRTHVTTRRTRTSMTGQLTWMRALSGALFATCLPARMWWYAGWRSRLELLATPACVRCR